MDLCVQGVLVPGHVSNTFLCSLPSPQVSTFDPVALFVSALNLNHDCPPTLLKSLADLHRDQEVWLKSYQEEKGGLQSLNTYRKITLGKYRALHKKGSPHALPTMYVLTIKRDENLLPQCAKSQIVVLGNHEDIVWSKSNKFTTFICSESLCLLVSMAVEKWCPLCQDDCKNAFCHGILPPDKVTIVRPPSGDLDADPHKYWLLL